MGTKILRFLLLTAVLGLFGSPWVGAVDEVGGLHFESPETTAMRSRRRHLDPGPKRVVRAVYAHRQLEQQYTAFWINHFNIDWSKIQELYNGAFPPCDPVVPQCDPLYLARSYLESSKAQSDDTIRFRDLSTAMIIYLDTYTNIDDGINSPNENYARELLELYAMGVDGGYTQGDVEELALVTSPSS